MFNWYGFLLLIHNLICTLKSFFLSHPKHTAVYAQHLSFAALCLFSSCFFTHSSYCFHWCPVSVVIGPDCRHQNGTFPLSLSLCVCVCVWDPHTPSPAASLGGTVTILCHPSTWPPSCPLTFDPGISDQWPIQNFHPAASLDLCLSLSWWPWTTSRLCVYSDDPVIRRRSAMHRTRWNWNTESAEYSLCFVFQMTLLTLPSSCFHMAFEGLGGVAVSVIHL